MFLLICLAYIFVIRKKFLKESMIILAVNRFFP